MRCPILLLLGLIATTLPLLAAVHSVRDGAWSEPGTWKGKTVPADGDAVHVRHRVRYDVESKAVIPNLHVSGVLHFATDRSTELNVGTLVIDPRAKAGGVEDVHGHTKDEVKDRAKDHANQAPQHPYKARLEVGTPEHPVAHPHRALIRLHLVDDADPEEAPAIIARPGGVLDLHGAPMTRTWFDLAADAAKGATRLELPAQPEGWRAGDELLVTAGERVAGHGTQDQSETIRLKAIDGRTLILEQPIAQARPGGPARASEVANLSRSVRIESAAGGPARGHTMVHRHAAAGISYARFHRLGKEGVLGRYPIHFHLVRDSMRGASVVGAAITDSDNRWVAIHGTEFVVARDCVGYQSIGHGFFLEDGSEQYNVLDRNLGVQAVDGRRLPEQSLPFDPNDGAAFWWANGRNTFIRNVACENETYGFRYDSQKRSNFDSNLRVRQPDGSRAVTDIRTLPQFRFDANESHSEGLYAMVFAGTDGAAPDASHPHHLENLSIWETHYGLRAQVPVMWLQNIDIHDAAYGIYRPWFDRHVYENLHIHNTNTEPFNRGQDDRSEQAGPISVDGLTFTGVRRGSMPMIQISDNSPNGAAASHVRGFAAPRDAGRPMIDRGGGTRVEPVTANGVPVLLHDWFGEGRSAEVVSTASPEFKADPDAWREEPPLTGRESRVREVPTPAFPKLLSPVDDHPPVTIVTWPRPWDKVSGTVLVRGCSTDDGKVAKVTVNGVRATPIGGDFHQWSAEITLEEGQAIEAVAVDAAGNRE